MWVIAEMEWHYNDLDHMQVFGPYYSEAKAKKVFGELVSNRKGNISYELKKVQKLKL
jgi:hypothetical protein